jgi:hypothetical protein
MSSGWDGNFADPVRYMGYVKMNYMAGMIGGISCYFGTNPREEEAYVYQFQTHSRVQALFSHLEEYLFGGELVTTPGFTHAWNAEVPAYEIRTDHANAHVMARKIDGEDRWLVGAWATDEVNHWVEVAIPDGGLMVVNCRPEGSIYTVHLGADGWLHWQQLDEDPLFPSLAFIGPGDFDRNQVVGLGDFSLFAGRYCTDDAYVWWDPTYDMDGNGFVGLGDFSLFAGAYGTSYTYASGAPGTVPEPASVALAAFAAMGLTAFRRR